MVDDRTLGVGAASGGRVARRHAPAVHAALRRRAVRIGSAADAAHGRRANLSAAAVTVLDTDGNAHALAAAFVGQTLGVQ